MLETTYQTERHTDSDGTVTTFIHLPPVGILLMKLPSPLLEDLYFVIGEELRKRDQDATKGLEIKVKEWERA